MKAALRTFGGVLAGLIGSFILVVLVELFSALVHPFPVDFQGTEDEICRHVERYPNWVLAVVVPMWAVTAFVGVGIARRAGGVPASVIVGLLLLAGLACNVSMLPYPMWFKVVCLLTIPASILGGIGGWRKKPQDPGASLAPENRSS